MNTLSKALAILFTASSMLPGCSAPGEDWELSHDFDGTTWRAIYSVRMEDDSPLPIISYSELTFKNGRAFVSCYTGTLVDDPKTCEGPGDNWYYDNRMRDSNYERDYWGCYIQDGNEIMLIEVAKEYGYDDDASEFYANINSSAADGIIYSTPVDMSEFDGLYSFVSENLPDRVEKIVFNRWYGRRDEDDSRFTFYRIK